MRTDNITECLLLCTLLRIHVYRCSQNMRSLIIYQFFSVHSFYLFVFRYKNEKFRLHNGHIIDKTQLNIIPYQRKKKEIKHFMFKQISKAFVFNRLH